MAPSDAEKKKDLKMLIEPSDATFFYYFVCNLCRGRSKIIHFSSDKKRAVNF